VSEKPEWDDKEVELTLVFKVRYKVNSDSYGDAKTLAEAMTMDVENAYLEPFLTLSIDDVDTPTTVTWSEVE
jgi:hypothetical protein